MESDNFLRDSWKHKAQEERGELPETQEEKDISLYRRLLADSKKHPRLKPLMEELNSSLGKYAESVVRLSYVRQGKLSKDALMAADHHRRRMHNTLIDIV